MQQTLFSIRATYTALIAYTILSLIMSVAHLMFPTGHRIDQIIPILCLISCTWLLFYFHQAPNKRHIIMMKYLYFITVMAFLPPAWYFVLGAVWHDWVFINEFPPISPIILIGMSVLIFMVPKTWGRHVIWLWCAICLPIVVFLISHPLELETPRGRELMVAFGPGGALLFIVLSYQRDLHDRFNHIENNLTHSRRQADTDALTGILNRRGALYWLSQHDENNTLFAGLIIDIDHFKDINDNFGHEMGDAILKNVASILQRSIDEHDCLARWGGDEFIILFANAAPDRVNAVAQQCWDNIRNHRFPTTRQVTCSIGMAQDIPSRNIDTIVSQADAGLYQAKRAGA